MEEVKRFLSRDRYAARTGIELVEVSRGYAKATMTVKDTHINAAGIVNGGAIFTLADLCFAAASCSHGQIAVTLNASISFNKPASTGILKAEASEISRSRKIVSYVIKVTDEQDELIAFFQGTAYLKSAGF